ncbi:hypothetical protein JCM21142_104176 [Saccharicrinis fermentans DSM 9555 = JCM 21142]|uniref:Carboxypeptidase regulatory-like domain-containing protein n=2 Tax=Saccharicrinis fermentans TaxID=982 RepID=W7YLI6_9BACT|nr:hypothetical protein JCM21142_104176 [Saccharicrinis fermentans DSM 9555 = JCM 21142]
MYKNLLFLSLTLALISCTEKEIDRLELQVKVKGKINLFSQFGEVMSDYSNVAITFTDTDKEFMAEVDSVGNYEITEFTTGSYNIFVTAPGFVTRKIEGVQFLGGDLWQLSNFSLAQPSTSIVSDLAITNKNGSLYLSGRIVNEQSPNTENFYRRIIIYFHDTSAVSPVNNTSSYVVYVAINEYNEFETELYGSALDSFYCVVCGVPDFYDFYYGGIGTPSNVVGYSNN